MFPISGARIVVLGIILVGTGCIIVPVPSVTPDKETGIIDEATLESLIGLDEEGVNERIGQPDYSGPRGHSYMMVYQGEKTYSTDLYVGAVGPFFIPVGGKNTTSTKIFHCYVIELDENHVVQGYKVIDNAPRGTRRDSSDEQVTRIADCSEVVWTPDEREGMKIAELEAQAEKGNTKAAIKLASLTGNLAPLRTLAERGDTKAAIELASLTGNLAPLRALAERGDRKAAIEIASLTGNLAPLQTLAEIGDRGAALTLAVDFSDSEPARNLAEKGDYEAAHILAAEFDDYSYLRRLAKEGDYVVKYEQFLNFSNAGEPSEFSAAWNWLCFAANAGYSKAQVEVGWWHRSSSWDNWGDRNEDGLELLRKVGVRPDNRIAYMWYTLAVATGGESTRIARDYYVAELLTDVEISQAEQMARDWKPGDCPSAEHRLSVPGET